MEAVVAPGAGRRVGLSVMLRRPGLSAPAGPVRTCEGEDTSEAESKAKLVP
mgnify:CR=1 FL=1